MTPFSGLPKNVYFPIKFPPSFTGKKESLRVNKGEQDQEVEKTSSICDNDHKVGIMDRIDSFYETPHDAGMGYLAWLCVLWLCTGHMDYTMPTLRTYCFD